MQWLAENQSGDEQSKCQQKRETAFERVENRAARLCLYGATQIDATFADSLSVLVRGFFPRIESMPQTVAENHPYPINNDSPLTDLAQEIALRVRCGSA